MGNEVKLSQFADDINLLRADVTVVGITLITILSFCINGPKITDRVGRKTTF